MTYPITDFTGACGEGTERGNPMSVSCVKGLQPNEQASVNGNTDLNTCLVANGHGCVYSITLTGSPGYYDYVVNVDAQSPSGFGSGSMYGGSKTKPDSGSYHSAERSAS